MRVLVLDGNQNQAVASVRSLARAGHEVLVGESSSWSKGGWSRYSKGTFQYPRPQDGAEAFVAALVKKASEQPGTLILPMTEATTLPISEQRDQLSAAGALMVLPAHRDLLRACNKDETTRLARSLGIKVPSTVVTAARRSCTGRSDVALSRGTQASQLRRAFGQVGSHNWPPSLRRQSNRVHGCVCRH